MARDDLQEHIEEQLAEADGTVGDVDPEPEDREEVAVAIQNLVCTECNAVNGREPRPTNVPDIKTECSDCGERTVHEYRVDSEVTEA